MNNIIEISQQILDATNGGLDIILELFPQANERKAFRLRDEKTPSANLKKLQDGNYVVTDFGGAQKPKNAIQLYAEERRIEWSIAVFELAKRYSIAVGSTEVVEAKPVFKNRQIHEAPYQLDDNGFHFESKTFTENELKILGPYVTEEVCMKYNLFSVLFFAQKKENYYLEIHSTADFPIFIFRNLDNDGKPFYKMLQPKVLDKSKRFRYFGGRPQNYMNGLRQVQEYCKIITERWHKENETGTPKDADVKADKLFICSGERDALNMASLGFFVVWQNSETANLDGQMYKELMDCTCELYNIPDIDVTGVREGRSLAMKYLDIKTIWLPEALRKRKDWRGNPRKDLCDYFDIHKTYSKIDFTKVIKQGIEKAYPMRFWDQYTTDKGIKYELNMVHLYYFLSQNGYVKLDDEDVKEGFHFIKIDEHLVSKIKPLEVNEFINDFLEKKNVPTQLRNFIYRSPNINEAKLSFLPRVTLDFADYTKETQTMFFSGQQWVISSKGIESFTTNVHDKYVWNNDIIDYRIQKKHSRKIDHKNIKIEPDYFKITKNEFDYDVEILDKDCEFMNFVIQISRVHWHKELVDFFGEDVDGREAYRQANLFNLAGANLSADEIKEQKGHFANKIYVLGYLLHRYKSPSKAWMVYAMENNMVEDGESQGGTGKSFFMKCLDYIINYKSIDGKTQDIKDDKFIFDGVDRYTDYVLFEDTAKNFDISTLYNVVTGDLNVNPKNNQAYTIPFKDSPKLAVTSNFPPNNSDGSTVRRILFTAFSNYYHSPNSNAGLKGYQPINDFKKEFFIDWDDHKWNKFFNFLAQCCKFYLSHDKKLDPPMDSVLQRSLVAEMGSSFMDWADTYLIENLDTVFAKNKALEDVKQKQNNLKNISSQNFVKKIKAWCRYNNYEFMPEVITSKDGRIQKNIDGKMVDCFFIQSKEISEATLRGEAEEKTDLPF